ncbi:allose kinase [Actinotalea fermentans]|uniref:D-allose kinase n=1 Tax=Actinotalea fermentans TaxID=43671 RepID=A0A511YZJ1_9CELL|nr:allose kinase [Actinotalea fermentans]KGM17075.1 hypothetical protein N867_10280 [Actinotalea fermentans ATCC 43279 = JCM 9966 = DSM 3133]GEN80634.1 D-allose kinase [Actinotalea fermentans]
MSEQPKSHPERAAVLAVDIGGTHLRTGMVDPALGLHAFNQVSSQAVLNVANPAERLADHLERFLSGAHGWRPAAVAVGFPATVDRKRRVVMSTSNIAAMQNMPVADVLEKRLGIPAFIDRDVNMLLRHDLRAHGLTSARVVIGCYVGTGLGNAISINGTIHAGRHGVAGELGHVAMIGLHERCGCGSYGCLETVASGRHLADLVRTRFPGTPVQDVFLRHGDEIEIKQYVRTLAVPVALEVNILDPDAVVLGGGVVQAPGFPRALLEEAVVALARKPLPASDIDFRYTTSGQEAGLVGAGIHAWAALGGPVPTHIEELQHAGSARK